MTREEAISEWTFRSNHIKKWLDEYGEEPSIRHYVELIDMAIEALQQIICKDCRHKYEEGDCTHYYWCRLHDRPVDDDNYCCWAERREP